DASLVTTECEGLPAGRYVPKLDGLIHAGRGQTPAVGAERHTLNVADVTAQRQPQLTGLHVPELHLAVGQSAPIPTHRSQGSVVRAERHGPNRRRMTVSPAQQLVASPRVPD